MFAQRDQPEVDETDCHSEPGQALDMNKLGDFKIEAMPLHITEHLLNPHASAIQSNRAVRAGEIGRQVPWFRLTAQPDERDIGDIGSGLAEVHPPKPEFVACLDANLVATQGRELAVGRKTNAGALTQDIVP